MSMIKSPLPMLVIGMSAGVVGGYRMGYIDGERSMQTKMDEVVKRL